ncbi:MAG: hypothetical protein B7Z73_15295, partial [Planctomycetia bacterium 21-64-5]
ASSMAALANFAKAMRKVATAPAGRPVGLPPERAFDFIVSNPPYVAEREIDKLSRDVREYEPRGALVAGPRGTETIARLIPQAAERLKPGGWLLMEISPQIERAVRELVAGDARLQLGPTVKDLAGLGRVIQAQRSA